MFIIPDIYDGSVVRNFISKTYHHESPHVCHFVYFDPDVSHSLVTQLTFVNEKNSYHNMQFTQINFCVLKFRGEKIK